MELRDIEYFAVIAEHGHLGRAADAPALSKSLRRLEQALQVTLVKRTPKGVELTAEGSALLLRVRELRLSLQDVAREIADVSQGRVGHLRIGVTVAISEQFLSAAFATLLKDAPRTKLIVSVSDNDLMIPALRNGELDLIIHYLPVSPPEGFVCEHLYDSEYVVCASAKHRLAGRKQVTLAELAQERWALNELTLPAQQRLLEFTPVAVCFRLRVRQRVVASGALMNTALEAAGSKLRLDLGRAIGAVGEHLRRRVALVQEPIQLLAVMDRRIGHLVAPDQLVLGIRIHVV